MTGTLKVHHATGIILRDDGGDILLVTGSAVIGDGSAGYAPGCILIDTTNGVVYINEGTNASSDFDAITTA